VAIDHEELARVARESLIQDECGMSFFGFADNFAELDLLRSTIEALIVREEAAEIDRLAPSATQLPENLRNEFWAENHPYWWEHIIAPQFRASFFIALMSAVELHLGHLTRDAGLVARAPIDAEDLKGAFYPRSRKFLKLFCGIDAPPESGWQRILNYYAVRNALVHRGGMVGSAAEGRQITTFSGQVDGLVIRSEHIELQEAFCIAAHRDCHAFLFDTWSELVLLCRRAR
jgi:hypothetical protein